MILFDMRTIVFSYVLTDIVCTSVIFLLWRQTRTRIAGTGYWALDFALQTAGIAFVALRGVLPDWMSIVLANVMVVGGAFLGYIALEHFVGVTHTRAGNYLALLAFAGVHAYFGVIAPDLAIRNLNLAVGLFIMSAQCVRLLRTEAPESLRQPASAVRAVFTGFCLVSVIRVIGFFAFAHPSNDFFQSSAFETFILVSYQMLFILLTYGLVLMYNGHLIAELETQEEKFSKAFHSSHYAITLTRMSDGKIIEVNQGFMSISGYAREDIVNMTTGDLGLWEREEDRVQIVRELAKTKKIRDRESVFRSKLGKRIIGLFSAEIITVNGELCVLSSISDITERKFAEEALHKYSERLQNQHAIDQTLLRGTWSIDAIARMALDHMDRIMPCQRSSVAVFDADMREAELFVYDPATAVAELTTEPISESTREGLQSLRDGQMHIAENLSRETRYPSHSLEAVVEGTGSYINVPLRVGDMLLGVLSLGRESSSVFSAEEIEIATEVANRIAIAVEQAHLKQKADSNAAELEKRVVERTNELNIVIKELDAFTFTVSHDLRSPLRAIDGFVRILLEDFAPHLEAEARRVCLVISQSARDMGDLIDDLLAFSRVGRKELQSFPVDMQGLVESVYQEVVNPSSRAVVDFRATNLPGAVCDPILIQQVWANLIGNAIKFSSKKEHPVVEISAETRECDVVYSIRDNGAGFDMKYADKLFGVFQRLHSVKDFEGTGVGLAIVERIVRRHGGNVWAEGEIDNGATFHFTLGRGDLS